MKCVDCEQQEATFNGMCEDCLRSQEARFDGMRDRTGEALSIWTMLLLIGLFAMIIYALFN